MCPEPRAVRAFPALLPVLATALLLTGCALPPAPAMPAAAAPAPAAKPATAPVAPPPAPAPAPSVAAPAPAPALAPQVVTSPVQGGLPGAVVADSASVNVSLLAHAERVRRMAPAELAQEIARLSEIPEAQRHASDELQLALALGATRQSADLVRAQGLLQRVLGNPREDVRAMQPLAALLAARYAEQRRVEDLLDKQAQQLKEQQRRIDQLNDRLEAVRAVERSLNARPAPASNTHRPQP